MGSVSLTSNMPRGTCSPATVESGVPDPRRSLGMFCEDECGKEECRKAKDQGLKIIDLLDDLMG